MRYASKLPLKSSFDKIVSRFEQFSVTRLNTLYLIYFTNLLNVVTNHNTDGCFYSNL